MGYQPTSAGALHTQKGSPVQPPGGLAACVEQEDVQPIVSLPTNIGQDLSTAHPVSGCRNNIQKYLPAREPLIGLPAVKNFDYHVLGESLHHLPPWGGG